ncbi:MAG: hypothetical protein KF802_10085 [Bdellovibrionaceae bacterium]|nr:hypothetical protein [Pseudobdellovibrionaceae bacterium]MBX3033760.1 hypothetical protein [Pseudobdellovibrionaceae bacterium]
MTRFFPFVAFSLFFAPVASWSQENTKFESMDALMGSIDELNRFDGTVGAKPVCEPAAVKTAPAKTTTTAVDRNGDRLELSVLTEAEAWEIFKDIRREKLALKNWEVCAQRAHRIGFLLDRYGIQSGKVFVHAGLGSLVPDIKGNENGGLRWKYHVAPMVMVRRGDQIVPYIFDPAVFDAPVPQAEWERMLKSHPKTSFGRVELTNRYVYLPSQSSRKMQAYDPEDLIQAADAMNRGNSRSFRGF